jgi:hypothetical protein
MGGRGWSAAVIIVGASAPLKKRKVEKGAKSPLPATKKKGVLVVSIRQDSGAIQQQRNSRDADTLPTNADKSTISPTNLL